MMTPEVRRCQNAIDGKTPPEWDEQPVESTRVERAVEILLAAGIAYDNYRWPEGNALVDRARAELAHIKTYMNWEAS